MAIENCMHKSCCIQFLYISICFCFEQIIFNSRKNCFLNLINLYRQHLLEHVLICLDCVPLFTAAATFTARPVDVFKNDSLIQGCNANDQGINHLGLNDASIQVALSFNHF